MKFVCVPCDQQMKLLESRGPDYGSISLVYSCDDCGYEFAMLTNPHETQVVGSLGVKIGGAAGGSGKGESNCPFTGMVQEMTAAGETAAGVTWTAEAEERLEGIPAFIRPMARSGIEKFAREHGYSEVDVDVLAEARSHFGM